MVLDDLLCRSWELTRYRKPPLGLEMDGFCQWMYEHGYSRSVMRSHIAKVSQFNWHLRCLGIKSCGEVKELHGERFIGRHLRERGCGSSRHTAPAVRRFMKYLSSRGFLITPFECPPYEGVLQAYADDLRNNQALADSTIKTACRYLTPLLQSLDHEDLPKSLSEVSPQEIHTYFAEQSQGKADTTRRHIQTALRTFFVFCAGQGYVARHLAETVPKVFKYRLADVPRSISEGDALKLLESVDRSTPVGRRDYAIIMLLHTYGVRGAQIRWLRLDDIQWRQSRIRFRSCKGGKEVIDPLTDEAGNALLDYLRQGRPATLCCEVFLTAQAPIHPLKANGLYRMIATRARRAEIAGSPFGPHAFRHAFATRMLNGGQSLKVIADMLGHRCLNSTFMYYAQTVDMRCKCP